MSDILPLAAAAPELTPRIMTVGIHSLKLEGESRSNSLKLRIRKLAIEVCEI